MFQSRREIILAECLLILCSDMRESPHKIECPSYTIAVTLSLEL